LGDAELERRALQLVSRSVRRALAAAIERVLVDAERPPAGFTAAVPLCRSAVNSARPLLIELEEELRSIRPVRAQGVALVRALLQDGASPLYAPCREQELLRGVEAALDTLRAEGR
jgi:hypothetical protein